MEYTIILEEVRKGLGDGRIATALEGNASLALAERRRSRWSGLFFEQFPHFKDIGELEKTLESARGPEGMPMVIINWPIYKSKRPRYRLVEIDDKNYYGTDISFHSC